MANVVEMPKLGFDMAEGTLVRWIKTEGETIAKGDILAEIETDKATVEVESAFNGVVGRLLVSEGDIVPVGTPIALIGEPGEAFDEVGVGAEKSDEKPIAELLKESRPASDEIPLTQKKIELEGRLPDGVKASPLARRMARDYGVELAYVKGSGPGGRVIKSDVEAYLKTATLPASPLEKAFPPGQPVSEISSVMTGEMLPVDRRIPLPRLRAAIGRRMVEAKTRVPHFYITHEFNLGPLMALRQQINGLLMQTESSNNEKLSVNDFLVKAVALTLRQFPNLNATIEGNEVIQWGRVNIGVAVAVEGGLLTVVCRDVDRKSLRQISAEVRAMVERARQGKVRPEDIEGSTFSISNLGMYDVEHFIAIINPPEAAILAVGSVKQVPVVEDGEVRIGTRMKATLSVDHRVSDGAEAARFMQAMAGYINEPLRLLMV